MPVVKWELVDGEPCDCDDGDCCECDGIGLVDRLEGEFDCPTCGGSGLCPTCGGRCRTTWLDARMEDGSRFWCLFNSEAQAHLSLSGQLPDWLTDEFIRERQANGPQTLPSFLPA